MKVRSCLEKLQDSSKFPGQLAAANQAIHSSTKVDFEEGEPSKQKLRQKASFSESEDNFIHKGIFK